MTARTSGAGDGDARCRRRGVYHGGEESARGSRSARGETRSGARGGNSSARHECPTYDRASLRWRQPSGRPIRRPRWLTLCSCLDPHRLDYGPPTSCSGRRTAGRAGASSAPTRVRLVPGSRRASERWRKRTRRRPDSAGRSTPWRSSFRKVGHPVGGYGRRSRLDHPRRGRTLDNVTPSRARSLEQGHADLGLADRRRHGLRFGEPASASTTCDRSSSVPTTGGGRGRRSRRGFQTSPSTRCAPIPCGQAFSSRGRRKSVYVSFDDGDHWQPLQLNLPRTSMRDLWIKDDDLIVATHGRSFWVLDDISPLRQLTEEVARSAAYLFAPAPAYRIMRSTYTDTPFPPGRADGREPPGRSGHRLRPGPQGGGTGDASRSSIRPATSCGATAATTRRSRARRSRARSWFRPTGCGRSQSGHGGGPRTASSGTSTTRRPSPATHGYPISAVPHDTPRGPLGVRALPGLYTVRLTVDGSTLTAPLSVVVDPRVKTPKDALRRQFDLLTKLSSLLTEGSRALRQARSVKEQLEALGGPRQGRDRDPRFAAWRRTSAELRSHDARAQGVGRGGPARHGGSVRASTTRSGSRMRHRPRPSRAPQRRSRGPCPLCAVSGWRSRIGR